MPVSGSKIRSGVTTHSPGQWLRLDWRWIWTVTPSCLADWGFSVWPPCSSCTAKRQRRFWRRSVHALLLCLVRVSPRLVSSPCINYNVHFLAWSVSVRVSLCQFNLGNRPVFIVYVTLKCVLPGADRPEITQAFWRTHFLPGIMYVYLHILSCGL